MNFKYLKILKLGLPLLAFILFSLSGMSQYKSYKLTAEGDTLNAIDKNDQKQGKWVIHVDEVRGEPGYEEEGVFVKDKKEGVWRLYNLTGDIIGVENYFNGGKSGIQQYYTYLGDLVREESWKGYNPEKPYDTVDVYGPNGDLIDFKIVEAKQYSVKHGEWKFYEPGSGRLMKTEKYDRGLLVTPNAPAKPAVVATDEKPKKIEKTAEMLDWEKKNKNKKKALRDGKTNL
jgi:antitoxin component YwqK of YwqJK toxin-antitoxin module